MPAGLHAMSPEECAEMDMMHHEQPSDQNHSQSQTIHGDDCPMEDMSSQKHKSIDGLGIDCTCSIDQAPVKTEAPVLQKVKVPVLVLVQVLAEIHSVENQHFPAPVQELDSYSPPPVYLANSSFLN